MEIGSFSLLLPNLFVGLSKRSRLLRPHSDAFADLGYEPFKFEGAYTTSGGIVNPDLIMTSLVVGNTLIIEWTENKEVDLRKQKQISKYSSITLDEVKTIMAVPVAAARSHDIALIVSETGKEPYREYLEEQDLCMPTLVLNEDESGYEISKYCYKFGEEKTNTFFSEGLKFSRIPQRYLQFPLDSKISMDIVAPLVIRHLISLIVKEECEFTIESFCNGYIPIWDTIEKDKQRNIKNATRQVLADLIKKKVGKALLARGKTATWEIIGIDYFKDRQRSVQTALNNFVAIIRKSSYSIPLFE